MTLKRALTVHIPSSGSTIVEGTYGKDAAIYHIRIVIGCGLMTSILWLIWSGETDGAYGYKVSKHRVACGFSTRNRVYGLVSISSELSAWTFRVCV